MKKLLGLMLLAITLAACTEKYPVLPQEDLSIYRDSTARLSEGSILVTLATDGKNYECRPYVITNQVTAYKWGMKKVTGIVTCPFCATANLVDVDQFGMCGKICMKPGCGTRFYPQPIFQYNTKTYARAARPFVE